MEIEGYVKYCNFFCWKEDFDFDTTLETLERDWQYEKYDIIDDLNVNVKIPDVRIEKNNNQIKIYFANTSSCKVYITKVKSYKYNISLSNNTIIINL